MHWLLLLALLSSTGDLKNVGGSNDALSRAAETSLRRQIGASSLVACGRGSQKRTATGRF